MQPSGNGSLGICAFRDKIQSLVRIILSKVSFKAGGISIIIFRSHPDQ